MQLNTMQLTSVYRILHIKNRVVSYFETHLIHILTYEQVKQVQLKQIY